jgi:hypothetical protein
MKTAFPAALALIAASSLQAQTLDYGVATPLAGTWTWSATAGGSEATFGTSPATPQLVLTCTRATRRVTIARPATAAAPFLTVWSTSLSRDVAASFNPLTNRISIEIPAYDPLLDSLAFSRGRFAVGVKGQPLAVVPTWPEVSRVIEDCRA